LEIVVNARHIVRRTLKTRKAGKTDWKRVDALTDEEIQRAVREDPDAAPIVDKAWFKMAKIVLRFLAGTESAQKEPAISKPWQKKLSRRPCRR
jgi:hypothetical protein